MCPLCMTAAVVAAGATTGIGVLGVAAIKLRNLRRKLRTRAPESR